MIWLPLKPLARGLHLLLGTEATTQAVVKIVEGTHLVSPAVGSALEQLATSVRERGFSFTILVRHDLVLALVVALLGKDEPEVAKHLAKVETAPVQVPIPPDPPPAVVAPATAVATPETAPSP